MPVGKREELIEGARGHRAAPDHRFILVDHEADGIDLKTVRLKRLHGLAVNGHRLPVSAEHGGLGGTIDVGIKNADLGTFVAERQREVRRHRRLADASLAGRNGNDVLDARENALRALDLVRNDLLLHVGGHRFGAELLHRAFNGGLHGLHCKASGIAEFDMNHHAALVVRLNALQHAGGNIVRTDHGIDQFGKALLDLRGGNRHGGTPQNRKEPVLLLFFNV